MGFCAAPTPEVAMKAGVSKLVAQGFKIAAIKNEVQQLDPTGWDAYVQKVWPEVPGHFPSQAQVIAGLGNGAVFFGPFAGYEQ